MKQNPSESPFALCFENGDCAALEKPKIYQVKTDEEAAREGYLRVIDTTCPRITAWKPLSPWFRQPSAQPQPG